MCKKCKKFLIEIKENGEIGIGDKTTNVTTGIELIKLTCQCKTKYEFKRKVSYDIITLENKSRG